MLRHKVLIVIDQWNSILLRNNNINLSYEYNSIMHILIFYICYLLDVNCSLTYFYKAGGHGPLAPPPPTHIHY